MTTPVWMTGFEYGLATPSASGSGLFSSVAGTPSIQTTIKHSGTYALELISTASNCDVNKTFTGDYYVGSVYIYFKTALPTAVCQIIRGDNTDADMVIGFSTPTNQLYVGKSGLGSPVYGPEVTYNTWYRIDFRMYTNATTHTIDWQVNGADQTQYSVGSRSAVQMTFITFRAAASSATDIIIDDVIVSVTSGDYPIGAGEIEGLRPGSDGTHNNAANTLEDSAGNDIDGSSVFAFDKLNESPWTSTADAGYVRQTANGTANYCEINFADTTNATIIGAMALLEYASETATANNGGCILIDEDATTTVLWGVAGTLADYSESSAFYKSVMMPTPAGGWDTAAVNAIKCRFGYSGDANPDPYWLAIMLEVAYVPSAGGPIAGSAAGLATYSAVMAGAGALTGAAAALATHSGVLIGSVDISGAAAGLATQTGALIGLYQTTGAATGEAIQSGVLVGAGALTGVAANIATDAVTLIGAGALSGALSGLATQAGALAGSGVISGTSAGLATQTGTLSATGAIAATVAGIATQAGILTGAGALSGTAAGVATYSATSTGLGGNELIGAAAGVATQTGALTGAGALLATVTSAATQSGALSGAGALAGSGAGIATLTGALEFGAASNLAGAGAGLALVEATLTASGILSGPATASATADATLTAAGILLGSVAGVGSISGRLYDQSVVYVSDLFADARTTKVTGRHGDIHAVERGTINA